MNRFPTFLGDFTDAVAFSPLGKYAMTQGHTVFKGVIASAIVLLDASSGREAGRFPGREFFQSIVSPDELYLLTAGYEDVVSMWDLRSGKQVRTFSGNKVNSIRSDYIQSISLSPSGKYVLCVGGDNVTRLWDAKTGQLTRKWFFGLVADQERRVH